MQNRAISFALLTHPNLTFFHGCPGRKDKRRHAANRTQRIHWPGPCTGIRHMIREGKGDLTGDKEDDQDLKAELDVRETSFRLGNGTLILKDIGASVGDT